MKNVSTKSVIALTAGKRFNELVILGEFKIIKQRKWYLCQCDCGNRKFIRGDQIRNGQSKSCCKRWTGSITHGMRKTRFYTTWQNILKRTNNPLNPSYKYYGDRGIKVCDKWKSFINFKNEMLESYLEHVEGYGTKNTQIDRIDNNKGYEKSNCRWATIKEQANNKRKLSS